VHNHFCQISSGFCIPKIIIIDSFLTELFNTLKGRVFWTTVYNEMC